MSWREQNNLENRATLTARCRPSGYTNPIPQAKYNLVVLGGGTAGMSAALGAAMLGAKVALVERDMLGGSRLHSATIPTKALVRAARASHDLRKAERFGVAISRGVADSSNVLDYVRSVQSKSAASASLQELLDHKIDVFFGEGSFADRCTVAVADARLHFTRAVIATGVRPTTPDIPGLAACEPLYSTTLWQLERLPESVAIIGGGPVGVELAQALGRLGTRVTLFEKRARILMGEDSEVSSLLAGVLEADGISLYTNVRTMSCELDDGQRAVECDVNGSPVRHTFEQILVTAGNSPKVERLNLERAAVEYDVDGIVVTEQLRTSNPAIFACGDVASDNRYPHAAEALARTVVGNALFFSNASVLDLNIPTAIFTDPEVARVGSTNPDGINSGLSTLRCRLSDCDRAKIDGAETGFVDLVHDRRGYIKGATVVSPRASDLIGEVVLAMNHRISLNDLAVTVHPYPTESEVLRKCGEIYRKRLLTPSALRLMKRIMDWRR